MSEVIVTRKTSNKNDSKSRHLDWLSLTIDTEGFNNEDGIIYRFRNGLLDGDSYSEDGKVQVHPAIEHPDGHVEYWRNGLVHRDNQLPAIISDFGMWEEYWFNGNLLSIKEFCEITTLEEKMGNKFRSIYIEENGKNDVNKDENGNPINGTHFGDNNVILRFKDGLLDGDSYAEDGSLFVQPAVETKGHVEYWRNGKLHRDDDLPAVSTNGYTWKEWWINGECKKVLDNGCEGE